MPRYRPPLTPWWQYNSRMFNFAKFFSRTKDRILLWIFHFKGGKGYIHHDFDYYAIHRDEGAIWVDAYIIH